MARLAMHSTAAVRPMAFAVAPVAIVGLLTIGILAHGIFAFFCVLLACALLACWTARYRRERGLLLDHASTVATVSDWQRSEGSGGGYFYEVRYRFLAHDGKVYIGRSGASSRELPTAGETVPILYRKDDPSQNLTMATFWFYRFTYTGTE